MAHSVRVTVRSLFHGHSEISMFDEGS